MKMYVWEGVLTDWTDGLVCVLAKNVKQAWDTLYKEDSTAWWVLQGHPQIKGDAGDHGTNAHDKLPKRGYFPTAIRPKVITRSKAFVVWGGG